MKVYDREGNVIEILDYNGTVLNEQARSARVLERRTGQFRMGPVLFWSGWSAVILGWLGTALLLTMSMLFWAGNHESPAWASGFGGVFLGVATFFGMMGMVLYYNKHGIPKRLKEKPVEMYCKSCQQKLEEELRSASSSGPRSSSPSWRHWATESPPSRHREMRSQLLGLLLRSLRSTGGSGEVPPGETGLHRHRRAITHRDSPSASLRLWCPEGQRAVQGREARNHQLLAGGHHRDA